MVKVINKETLIKDRFNSGVATPINIFQGTKEQNLKARTPATIGPGLNLELGSERWVNSAGYHKL